MIDAWRLAVGMLTVVRVKPPGTVDRHVAGRSMLLAPLAVLPLGLAVALVGWGGRELGVAPLALGFMAVGALALGNRAFHLDGLADVADALTASYDRDRSLAVMKDPTSGPAGIAILVVTLGVQAAVLGGLFTLDRGPVVAGVLVCASRAVLALTCAVGVPAAAEAGLAATYAGTVARVWSVVTSLLVLGVLTSVLAWAGAPWWQGPATTAAALLVVAAVLTRCVRRFGGVTGDVYGATIELALAAMLVVATAG